MDMDDSRYKEWSQNASEDENALWDKVYGFGEMGMFDDLLFKPGSLTGRLAACQSKGSDGVWMGDDDELPISFRYFSYAFFTYHVEDEGADGCFDAGDQSLSVRRECLGRDVVVLHEMIHLHEFVLDGEPLFYHDIALWALYSSLRGRVPDLDGCVTEHAHLLNEKVICARGGVHDILFLLKSFDLDLRMDYPLGTVFGYGLSDWYAQDGVADPKCRLLR